MSDRSPCLTAPARAPYTVDAARGVFLGILELSPRAARRMPLIDATTYRSPNYNARPASVRAIVLHTTEGAWDSDAEWLCNQKSDVSTHYVISPVGAIYQLVPEAQRAWHAGVSSYMGLSDWNDFSVGIELSHQAGQPWPAAQMPALDWLCRSIINRYHIPMHYVVAHRWIAPARKHDPSDWPDADLRAWIETLYSTAPPTSTYFTFPGLPVYRSSMLIGGVAVHIPDGAQLEIDQIGGNGYSVFAGHVKRASWGTTELREPGFVDMRLLSRK